MSNVGQQFQKDYQKDKLWSSQKAWDRTWDVEQQEVITPIGIGPNDIILGYEFPEFKRDEVQVLDFGMETGGERNVLTVWFIGQAGSGKSGVAANVFLDNLVARMNHKMIVIDPQREWHKHRNPFVSDNNSIYERELAILGEKRCGYDIVTVSPAKLDTGADYNFKITVPDIKELAEYSVDDATVMGMGVLGIDKSMDHLGYSADRFKTCMAKPRVATWADFRKELESATIKTKDEKGNSVVKYLPGTTLLLNKLNSSFSDGVISNKPEDRLPILQLVRDHQVIDYWERMKKGKKDDYIYLATSNMMMITLQRILNDMESWNKERSQASVIKKESLAMLWDEADQFADLEAKAPTTDFVTMNMTKDRKTGISTGLIVQEASLTYKPALSQCKYRFSSKLSAQNATVFRDIKINRRTVENLFKLEDRQRTSAGTYVPQWAVFSPDGRLVKFIPKPSCSELMRRKI